MRLAVGNTVLAHRGLRDGLLLLGLGLVGLMLAKSVSWAALMPRGLDAAVALMVTMASALLAKHLLGMSAAVGVLFVTAMASLVFAGPVALASTVLVVTGGAALGTLLPRLPALGPMPRWVAGMGLLAALIGWLLPLPIHGRSVWAFGLLVLVLVRRTALAADARLLRDTFSPMVAQAPWAAVAWALVVFLATTPSWLPLVHIDDLAYHMNLGSELLRYGHGRMDIGSQSWALAPWSTDALHAVVSVLAGEVVAGPLNAAWLVATALLVVAIGQRLGLSPSRAWLGSMLYTSLPLSAFLSGSMQTEAVTPAVMAALALVLLGDEEERGKRLHVLAVLAGFMMGAKISGALLLVPIALWMAFKWRDRFPWRALPLATTLGLFAGGSSYVYATVLTGNPIVPMLNGHFKSPWFPPENFVDATWQTGLHWDTPWNLVAHTSQYFEGQPGAAGIALLGLSAGALAALTQPRVRWLAVVALAALLAVFSQVQYLRYIHPAMTLALPAFMAALVPAEGRWSWREVGVAALVALQLWLMPTTSWVLGDGVLRLRVLEGAQAVRDRYVPERAVSARFAAQARSSDRVLYMDPARSHGGELPGIGIGTAWFTPITARLRPPGKDDPQAWATLVERTGSNHLMVYDLNAWPDVSDYLAKRGAVRIDGNGAAALYWLPPPRSPAKASAGPDGAWTLELPMARPYPVIGQSMVRLRCSRPGAPIAVSWAVAGAPAPGAYWEWVSCGPHRFADAAVQYALPALSAPMVFRAVSAQPGETLELSVTAAWSDVRRDFHAQTALSDWLLRGPCLQQGCTPSDPPFTSGLPWAMPMEQDLQPARPDVDE